MDFDLVTLGHPDHVAVRPCGTGQVSNGTPGGSGRIAASPMDEIAAQHFSANGCASAKSQDSAAEHQADAGGGTRQAGNHASRYAK